MLLLSEKTLVVPKKNREKIVCLLANDNRIYNSIINSRKKAKIMTPIFKLIKKARLDFVIFRFFTTMIMIVSGMDLRNQKWTDNR